ncbi:MAG: hypothetical protein P8Y70_15860 [Candidatus Lokiarchaeota archaeon]
MKFEKDILWVLENNKPEDPIELWELIAWIDFRQREVASYDELRTAIKTLILNGEMKEIAKLQYCKTQGNETRSIFTKFSESEYEEAVKKYREWFDQELKRVEKEEEEPMDIEIIRVTWITDKKISKELKNCFIEDLERKVEEELIFYPREISVYDKEKRQISFRILSINNVDAHEVYDIISPLIKDFIEKNGGKCEIHVANKGEEKKIYFIEYE